MSERLILKGQLSDLKMKRMGLEVAADANIKSAKAALAFAGIRKINEIDVETALVNLKEAAAQKVELTEVIAEIEKIMKVLD